MVLVTKLRKCHYEIGQVAICAQAWIFFTKFHDFVEEQHSNMNKFSVNIWSEKQLFQITALPSNWILTEIYLNFSQSQCCCWSLVSSLRERELGHQATRLMVGFPKARTLAEEDILVEERAILSLNLPKVKQLKLVRKNYYLLDFLLPTRDSLKHVNIIVPI